MKNFLCLFLVFLLISFSIQPVFGQQSDYVLPYPSFMPGSKFYMAHGMWEIAMEYWYFGNLSKFSFYLKQSDKYIVEARTLFEYKQYLFGNNALKKSDIYFKKSIHFLSKAKDEGKNITQKHKLLNRATLKHLEVLNILQSEVPKSVDWMPEKSHKTTLDLNQSIEESILVRKAL